MGMYTELIFQGEMIEDIPEDIKPLFDYFFNEEGNFPFAGKELPDHPFFKCPSWYCIGYVSSYYFTPFSLRYKGSNYIFMRCDIKNYHEEIAQFLDWIHPYMHDYYGYYWYEEDHKPTFFHNKEIVE